MFLNSLNPIEKANFIKLAVAVIKADGIVVESEKQILSAYANEMQCPIYNLNEETDIDKIINEFITNSTLQTKRIVFLELLALAFVDGNYTIEEKTFIKQLANAFELDNAFIEKAINLEDAYMAVYMSMINLVEKGS